MASLKRLNELLTGASKLLNEASYQVRDLDLQPQQNIRKIGELLVDIFDIQMQVHEKRPDLIPEYLQGTDYHKKLVKKKRKKKKRRKAEIPKRR